MGKRMPKKISLLISKYIIIETNKQLLNGKKEAQKKFLYKRFSY